MTETMKPKFDLEVKAQISEIGKIESNISLIKDQALKIQEHYESLVITEDMLADIKKEKADVNKAKDAVASYRRKIVAEFKKPIDVFEKTAKETEAVLKQTYDCINEQVQKYEDETQEQKRREVRSYFEEYAASLNIDFVQFESANINVTLNSSLKSLKEAAKAFLDTVDNDLKLIDTQTDRIEILADYKRTLDVSGAIMNVKARKEAEARERERQEILAKARLEQEAQIRKVEEAVAEVTAPVEIVEEEVLSMSFRVYGTIEILREVKRFLDQKGIRYDTGN